jgi:hypothetical protein
LCWRVGLPASLGIYKRNDKREAFKNSRVNYTINIPNDIRISKAQHNKKYTYNVLDDGYLLKVRSVSKVQGVSKVYDLKVRDIHNYCTSSFLVHNSGAGCLINYLLGITDVNPLLHGLMFSRFLSPARGGKSIKLFFSGTPCA